MQCKDIPTEPILRVIAEHGGIGCNWFQLDLGDGNPRGVRHAMPPGVPGKVVLAKMAGMIKKGLIDGCPCGCRGDYELTAKGAARIGQYRLEASEK